MTSKEKDSSVVLQCPVKLHKYLSSGKEFCMGYVPLVKEYDFSEKMEWWVVFEYVASSKQFELVNVPKDLKEYMYDF